MDMVDPKLLVESQHMFRHNLYYKCFHCHRIELDHEIMSQHMHMRHPLSMCLSYMSKINYSLIIVK